MAKTCHSCGKTYEIDIRFCLECGGKLDEDVTQAPRVEEPSEPAPTPSVQKAPQEIVELHDAVMPTLQTPQVASPKPVPRYEDEAQMDLLADLSDKVASISASLDTVAEMNLLILKKTNKLDKKISALISRFGHQKERQSRE